jgi:SAM-dependent methyltransferase
VLELGIGTGRMALPLAAKGVEVHGIDASSSMVSKLRQKPGGERIPVTMDDFANVGGVQGGPFDLVFVVFNTFFGLLAQGDQVGCFKGVSSILSKSGVFALELFVPDLSRFTTPQPVLLAGGLNEDEVRMEASRHDMTTQRVSSRMIRIKDGQAKIYPIEIRYAWPSELDLMARLAGMELKHRWSGWDRLPFGPGSGIHISVYQRQQI